MQNITRIKNGLGLLLIAAVAGMGLLLVGASEPGSLADEQTQVADQAVLGLNVERGSEYIAYDGVAGEFALDTLRSLAEVETQSSDFGEFVSSIDGRAADANSEYWAFYVNGQLAPVGAGAYSAQAGDRVEWKLEQF